MGRLVRGWGWACAGVADHSKPRYVSTDRLGLSEILIEGELEDGDPSGGMFWIAPGWRRVDEGVSYGVDEYERYLAKPDYTGLRNFMAGCAKAACRVCEDFMHYRARQREGLVITFGAERYVPNDSAVVRASAEWSRRVSEKVKQHEQGRRESVPWDPYAA